MRVNPDANQKAWDSLLAEIKAANGATSAVVLFQDMHETPLHHTMQRYMGGQKAMVRGYSLLVSGSTRIDGRYGSTHIINPHLGSGTSRYRITSDNVNAESLRQRWKKLHDEHSTLLPSFDVLQESYSAGAYIIIDPSTTKPSLCLIVHAGDMPAALAAIESRQRHPKTVSEFFKSRRYRDLVKSSQDVRDQIAAQLAKALEINIDEDPDVTVLTNAILPAEHVAHQSNARDGAEEYVVLVDGFETSTSDQGVLVHQGPMGGYALVQKTRAAMLPNGSQSRAWKTESMSVLSANAPLFDEAGSSGESALHRNANNEARNTFAESVFWRGTLQTPHTRADEQRTLVTQSLVHSTAKPLGTKDDELRVVQHQMIAVQLAEHQALSGMTLKELVEHAKATGAKSLPVPLDSEAMRELTRHFDSLQTDQTLADVLANSVTEAASDMHTVRSACNSTNPTHHHYWYDEKEDSDSGDDESSSDDEEEEEDDDDDDEEEAANGGDEYTVNQELRARRVARRTARRVVRRNVVLADVVDQTTKQGQRYGYGGYGSRRYFPRRYHPRIYRGGYYRPLRRTNLWLDAALIAGLAGASALAAPAVIGAPLAYDDGYGYY